MFFFKKNMCFLFKKTHPGKEMFQKKMCFLGFFFDPKNVFFFWFFWTKKYLASFAHAFTCLLGTFWSLHTKSMKELNKSK